MKRKWVSYSLWQDAVFCASFLLFTDSALRGKCLRPLKNWKKQTEKIHAHEKSNINKEAKAAQVLFQKNMDVESFNSKQKFVSRTK